MKTFRDEKRTQEIKNVNYQFTRGRGNSLSGRGVTSSKRQNKKFEIL